MHNLRIEGRKIFLDGFEVKDVQGYELREDVGEPVELTLRLNVQNVNVGPSQGACGTGGLYYGSALTNVGEGSQEVIAPLSALQGMLETSNEGVTDVLKQILATMKAADKETVIKIDGAELGGTSIKAINEVQRSTGSGPLNSYGRDKGMPIYETAEEKVNETVIYLCDYIQESITSKETDRLNSLPSLVSALASLIRG